MALQEELQKEVKSIFQKTWDHEKATTIPELDDLRLNSNHAKELGNPVVLYADIDGSTSMVEGLRWSRAAEVYKAYLRCASEIIRNEGGTITAYDGDRVMGVFLSDTPNTDAVRAALKINGAVINIINPAFKAQYSDSAFVLKHVVGVYGSTLRVAKIGVHGDNDLVWVGTAANYAAKLCTLGQPPTWIGESVYKNMKDETRLSNGTNMWQTKTWNNVTVYCSTYYWKTI